MPDVCHRWRGQPPPAGGSLGLHGREKLCRSNSAETVMYIRAAAAGSVGSSYSASATIDASPSTSVGSSTKASGRGAPTGGGIGSKPQKALAQAAPNTAYTRSARRGVCGSRLGAPNLDL